MNKKICSIMLSLVMTMSVWGSFCGTVMADTTDPGDPDPIKQEEQEPEDEKSQQDAGPEGGSGAGNAPEIDISTWPEASFTINPQPLNFAHGGYLDVNCEFYGSGIVD